MILFNQHDKPALDVYSLNGQCFLVSCYPFLLVLVLNAIFYYQSTKKFVNKIESSTYHWTEIQSKFVKLSWLWKILLCDKMSSFLFIHRMRLKRGEKSAGHKYKCINT